MTNSLLTTKQGLALKYLTDDTTNTVLYGGAAGGGKSYLGCAYIVWLCTEYDGVRCLIGRSKLEVCDKWGIKANKHYTYNAQANTITFYNGSQVILKDLFQYPSDRNFDSLGSLELTAAFIDECNQITEKAYQIVSSRIRYKLDEYNLIPKVLLTCNPSKEWVYSKFYKPSKEGRLPDYLKFIPSLVTDNRHVSKHYAQQLEKLDHVSKQRLLFGNWEYDDTDDKLIDYNAILGMFEADHVEAGEKYITADIARYGKDKTVIAYWNGLRVEAFKVMDVNSVTEAADEIRKLQQKYSVALGNIIVDDDGVGGGVRDILRCKAFVNNSKALKGENYINLKTQCYYALADAINKSTVSIHTDNTTYKNFIVQELEQVRRKNFDKDTKLQLISKDEVKAAIGRSPDFSDALAMRMYYELKPQGRYYIQ